MSKLMPISVSRSQCADPHPSSVRKKAIAATVLAMVFSWAMPVAGFTQENGDHEPARHGKPSPLKVDVYPMRLQQKAMLYEEYRRKVPRARRDPLREVELATGIAADLLITGHREEAAAFLRKARKQLTESQDPVRNALARADIEHALAYLAEQDGAFAERTRHLLAAETALANVFGPDHPVVITARIRTAKAELEQGFARALEGAGRDMVLDALRRLKRAAKAAERKFGPNSRLAIKARLALTVGSATLNRNGRALKEIDKIIARLDERDAEQRFLKAAALAQKAKLLNWLGRDSEAVRATSQATALLKPGEIGGPIPAEEFAPEEYQEGKKHPTLRRRLRSAGVSSSAGSANMPGGVGAANDLTGGTAPITGVTARDFASSTAGSWVLIGLCIDAEGHVQQAEMLDHGGPSKSWAEHAFKLAKERSYLPMSSLGPGECAPQMIRLAEVSEQRRFVGSHIRLRSQATAIRMIDLARNNPLSGGYVAAGLAAEKRISAQQADRTEGSSSGS